VGGALRVGLISDTHGRLDERAVRTFDEEEVAAILHAGDIGAPHILYELGAVAPVTAVLGNNDYRIPGLELESIARVRVGGVRFLVIHDILDLGPIPDDVDVVVCGHTHRPRNEWHGNVLVANPGSATQRRAMPNRSVGIIDVAEDGACASLRIIDFPA